MRPTEWVGIAACLLLFVVYKVRDLGLPYFWDEVGVYARAALYLHDHTLGLLPKHLPPDLSRGHPLLFPFVVASLFRLFGPTPMVAHISMLAVSVGFVVSVFWIARLHFGRRAGMASAILLMVQPLFVAQSTLVLPEIALGLTSLWALHSVVLGKYGRAGVFLTIALLVKETAVALDVVVVATMCIRFAKARSGTRSMVAVLSVGTANAVCVGFFLIQKAQNGWYFFPEHVGYVDFHMTSLLRGLWVGGTFVFAEQGRAVLSAVIAFWLVWRWRRPSPVIAPGFLAVLATFAGAVLLFSAGNVFMKRYLLCLLPPLAIVGGRAVDELTAGRQRLMVVAGAILGVASLSHLAAPRFNCEYDMSFRQAVRIQQEATAYVVENIGVDRSIVANFPAYAGLEDPRFGYAAKRFARFSYDYTPAAEFIFASEIFSRFEPPPGVRTDLVKRFSSPFMNLALYRIVR